MDSPNRLFLLDAYALIFRAYYALIRMPRLTSTGFNTSAVFGFTNTLEEILKNQNPTHMAVCFDPQGPTFRHKDYEEYKAQRDATPEDIKQSIPIIKQIIEAYRIPILECEGFEADDVIGTMARRASEAGFLTYMMTPDKDFGQLVTPTVLQYKPSYRGQDIEVRGVREVCERYDIEEPSQVIDMLALVGDKIDNIPGCPGIGEKTAQKLIHDFHDVENLLAHTSELKGAVKRKVEENTDLIRLSRHLATIRTDVPVPYTPEDLKLQAPDTQALFALFDSLEFRTLAARVRARLSPAPKPAAPVQGSLFDDPEPTPEPVPASRTTIELPEPQTATEADLEKIWLQAQENGRVGIYTATDGTSDFCRKVAGWALVPDNKIAWWLPASLPGASRLVADLYADSGILTVSHDTKRDLVTLSLALDINPRLPEAAMYADVSIMHYLLQPDQNHTPEHLAQTYLSHSLPAYESIGGKGTRQTPPTALPVTVLAPWAAMRALTALNLYEPLLVGLQKEGLEPLLLEIEHPLIPVLAQMELTGVCLDRDVLKQGEKEMEARMNDLEKEIHSLVGFEFNIASPAKVGEVLFDHLALDSKAKKTKTGQYSTSEEILEKLVPAHPVVEKILLYRQLKKLLNTYLTALPGYVDPTTDRIHTNYNQTVTSTGRISSSDPNLQNIPIRDDMGREIRRAFIPEPGQTFLSADYSQIELRLIADMAQDGEMLRTFAEGGDIHTLTAAKIYHLPPEEVSSTQRRNAKTANFGILYGISPFGLSTRLRIPRAEAKMLIDGYMEHFPAVRTYLSRAVEDARETGLARTIHGRLRRLPDINSRNPVVRGYAERNAVNAPIQGSAADIIKIAMIAIDRKIREQDLQSRMIMQVHDELNFTVPPQELETMRTLVRECMEEAYSGAVRLTASIGTGPDWLSAH